MKVFSLDAEIAALIEREGGYVNDPNDSGGETNFGITEFTARSYGYHGEMATMHRSVAVEIYQMRYWYGPIFHEVNVMSKPIAGELFDTGVNAGTDLAVKFLQRWLNAFNRRGELWPEIKEDGRIGAMTLEALRRYLRFRSSQNGEAVMVAALNGSQAEFYRGLSQARPKDEDFVFGWVANRVL